MDVLPTFQIILHLSQGEFYQFNIKIDCIMLKNYMYALSYFLCILILGKQIVTWQQNLMLLSFIIGMKLKFNTYCRVWDKGFSVLILQYNICEFEYAYKKKKYSYLCIYNPYISYLLILVYYLIHDTCTPFIS